MPAANSSTGSNHSRSPERGVSSAGGSSKRSKDKEVEKEKRRSREGCLVCRARKKRCDMVRPCCGACSRLSFECKFPAQVLDPITGELVTVKQPNKRKKRPTSEGQPEEGAPTQDAATTPRKKQRKTAATAAASSKKGGTGTGGGVQKAGGKGKEKDLKREEGDGEVGTMRRATGRSTAINLPSYKDDEELESSSEDSADSDADFTPYTAQPSSAQPLNSIPNGFPLHHLSAHLPPPPPPPPLLHHNSSEGRPTSSHTYPPNASFTPPILYAPSDQHPQQHQPRPPLAPSSSSSAHLEPVDLSPIPTHSTSPSAPMPSVPSPSSHPHPLHQQPIPPTSSSYSPPPGISFKGMIDLMLSGSGMTPEQVHHFQQQQQLLHQSQQTSPLHGSHQQLQDPMSVPSPSFSAWMEELGEVGASSSSGGLGNLGMPFSPSNWLIPSPPPGTIATPPPSSNSNGFASSSHEQYHFSSHQHSSSFSLPGPSSSSRNNHHDINHHDLHSHLHDHIQNQAQLLHPQNNNSNNNSQLHDAHRPDHHTLQQQPFDPTYPHLIPILSPNNPPHLPHQLPSPFLATHQSLPWSPIASASHPSLSHSNSNNPTSNGATIIDSDSFFSSLPSPFLDASLEPVPDDGDGEVDGFVSGTNTNANGNQQRPGSSSSGSSSGESLSRGGVERSPRRDQHQRLRGTVDGRELADRRRNGGKRETLTIAPSVTFNLPDLPDFIIRQAPLLFDYFVAKLAPLVSVLAPDPGALSSLRNFRGNNGGLGGGRMFPGGLEPAGTDIVTVFLPMAFESDLVLISILAWSAMHLSDSGEPWSEIADVATSDASERVQQALSERESSGAAGRRGSDVPVSGKDEELLAGLALLSEIEICRGSTQNWFTPLKLAQQIIRGLGGPKKLQTMSGNGLWLLRNIAYHELLSSSTSLDGPALDPEEYGAILSGGINSFMGCCQPVFQIIAEISRLSVEASRCITYGDRDARIESLRILAAKESRIKARLDTCYPAFAFSQETSSASSYHFVTFRAWVLTARLYLRQVVSHCNAHSLVSQLLMSQLLESISLVVGTPAESSLLFPIFVAGVDSTMERDRRTVKGFFDTIDANCRIGNIQTAYALLEEVWKRNEAGEKWISWAQVSREKGWNVSFA